MAAKLHHSNVYVQDCDSRRLLTRDLQWTDDATEAEDFGTAVNALAYCLNRNLNGAQVLIHSIAHRDPDLVVPVTP